ncbi:Flagellar hook protein FlgE [Methylocella tundrae]|uniref:Flagellar hook protein FlgE n=1 Tax=Methylocella tundrae TaxID=227605 RepID=A0A8B6M5E1_METTU|nr:flagellar hook protein FlgE [Methylocella tundrae]VTZ50048.1 Flagellar hook protein FlgE [Methylocella tundrae]
MSLFSALTASVSGMTAQANKLSTVSDNISNSDTTGYKQASTEFSDLLNETSTTSYNAAGVGTFVRYDISSQGSLTSASSTTDLGIQGNGFFLVTDSSGATYLTRAGNFTPSASGDLVNAAGFTLLGYSVASGSTSADGISALQPVNVTGDGLKAVASTTGTYTANLNSDATAVTGALPSANLAASTYTSKSTLVTYDNLGNAVTLDIYSTKTGANTWEQSIYNGADAAPGGGFPYSTAALSTQTLNFSAADGSLTTPTSVSVAIPNGQTLNLSLAGTTQLASSFAVTAATTNGSAPSAVKSVSIDTDGVVSEVFANGTTKAISKIPLASVASVNNLTSLAGDVYQANTQSGSILVGDAGLGGLGSIQSSQLESSTVDLATQLTDMIVAQRSYEANSKVFQAGSDLLSQLNNMLK